MIEFPRYEVPQQMRALAETNVGQVRAAFDNFMAVAKRSAEVMRGASGPLALSTEPYARCLQYTEQNVHVALDHARRLSQAENLQEVSQLQIEFLRGQFTAMMEQAREFSDVAQTTFHQSVDQARSVADRVR